MIGEAKYIIFSDHGDKYAVIFPIHVNHNAVKCPGEPVSAGFLSADMKPGGYSVGLELQSRPEDEAIIKAVFDIGGE